jgi:hypothetical protein
VHPVQLEVTDDRRRSRLTVLFRLFLAIPHLIFVLLWSIAAYFAAFANWLAVLVNGESPPVLHDFLAGYVRYATHVGAYVLLDGNPFPKFGGSHEYPVDVTIAPPVRQSRWTGFFRLVLALPAFVLMGLIGFGLGAYSSSSSSGSDSYRFQPPGVAVVAAVGIWFAALALGRAPRGLRDLSAYALGYTAHTLSYFFLLTGRYPDSHPGRMLHDPSLPYHPVRLRLEDDLRRSRLTVFFRLLLAIPHLVWLFGWAVLAYLASIINWFAALIIGRSPRPLHRFLSAYVRYASHVMAFLYLIANPFPGFVGNENGSPVGVVVDGPSRQRRLVTLFRFPLLLPAALLWAVLGGVLVVVAVGGWFAALATGRMPSGLRSLGAVLIRYGSQVSAYALIVTDRYPNSSPALRTEPPAVES